MLNDIRYALRLVRKSPTAFAIAVLTLAIGVGANTAIFSLIRAVVLKPLPYADADRLVGSRRTMADPLWTEADFSAELSRLGDAKYGVRAVRRQQLGRRDDERRDLPLRVEGSLVSPTYFDVFGLHAALGRTFAPDEDQPGREKVVLLSHQLWVTQFGGNRAVIGRPIRLDGESYTIVGVMPAGASVDFGFDLSIRSSGDRCLSMLPRRAAFTTSDSSPPR